MTVAEERNPVTLRVDGVSVRAYAGDTVAAALIAQQLPTMRSLKYHRPRAPFCMDGHCGSCLMRIDGEPNMRACMTPVHDGLEVCSQNALPTATHDALGIIDRVYAQGLDHHAIMTGSRLQNRVAQVVVRQLSGQGTLPVRASSQEASLPAERLVCDVLVVGGGVSGCIAAASAAAAGATTLLIDDGFALRGVPGAARVLTATALLGVFHEHGRAYAIAASASHTYRLEPRAWVWATGSYAQNAVFANNDLPGVFAVRAVAPLLAADVLVGEHVLIASDAASMAHAQDTAALLRPDGTEVTIAAIETLVAAHGDGWVRGATLATPDGEVEIDCDAICVAVVGSPAFEGPAQHGCEVALREAQGGFIVTVDARQATSVAGAFACGAVTGELDEAAALAQAEIAGRAAAAYASAAYPTTAVAK
ncbi:MAG: (2Fe-2S)-binding protein [Myxococcales bacterium]|nr:(2Fe-2S)-binding protein [Myxococcales bacterium]